MKPFYAKVTSEYDNSITIRYEERDVFYPHWHYHDEYELVFIHKSCGLRYVSDSINPYKSGDLVLLGSRVPHIWMNKVGESQVVDNSAASTVMHIQRKFVHNDFFNLNLMEGIRKLFETSARGIRFIEFNGIEGYLDNIQSSESIGRIIAVFNLLSALSEHKNIELLASKEYHEVAANQRNDRLSKIHEYIAKHFREKISLNTLAEIVHMTPQAFCNYFKSKSTKTVFTYINDLKVGYSCKLLIESDLNIDQIAHQSGFNNTTFFNRKFKEKMKLTPKVYRQKFVSLSST